MQRVCVQRTPRKRSKAPPFEEVKFIAILVKYISNPLTFICVVANVEYFDYYDRRRPLIE
jgi:hypothetical protein